MCSGTMCSKTSRSSRSCSSWSRSRYLGRRDVPSSSKHALLLRSFRPGSFPKCIRCSAALFLRLEGSLHPSRKLTCILPMIGKTEVRGPRLVPLLSFRRVNPLNRRTGGSSHWAWASYHYQRILLSWRSLPHSQFVRCTTTYASDSSGFPGSRSLMCIWGILNIQKIGARIASY